MFDTNCFYQIKFIEVDDINKFKILITKIQEAEIIRQNFKDKNRKERFLSICKLVKTNQSDLKYFVIDHPVAGILDSPTLELDGGKIALQFLIALNAYRKEKNNLDDALIAENAIQNNAIFVTNEEKLRDVVNREYPARAISLHQFKEENGIKIQAY